MKSLFVSALTVVALAGCGDATTTSAHKVDAGEVEASPVVFNAAGAPVVEFEAPAMHCEACAATIVTALRDKPGVVDAKADPESKVVTVAVEEAEFDADTAIAAIADAGFGEATLVEEGEPAAESEPAVDNAG